ncbi:MAG: DHHA1 domain-containing protein [Clostridiales bacterium]|nr:DHHA1 domain-containing protein [Clostridiales bacterium]
MISQSQMYHYRQMVELLKNSRDLLLTAHHDPDADCLGSMLGLYHVFAGERLGWKLVLEDVAPPNLRYLPGVELIMRPQQVVGLPAGLLLVDCGEYRRASNGWLDVYSDLPAYCIDHHVTNEFRGSLAVVEPTASSTGEIVAAMCEYADIPIAVDAATCLYSAIVSDTGCFRYENTTPRALEITARLLKLGVDMEQVRIHLFESRSPAGISVLQAAFRNMRFVAQGKICYSFVRYEEALASRAVAADFNNIANFTLMRFGVIIGLFFEEYSDGVKVSLRSRQGLRMDELAKTLGGGGHVRAAGCRIIGNLDHALQLVLAKAKEMLESM